MIYHLKGSNKWHCDCPTEQKWLNVQRVDLVSHRPTITSLQTDVYSLQITPWPICCLERKAPQALKHFKKNNFPQWWNSDSGRHHNFKASFQKVKEKRCILDKNVCLMSSENRFDCFEVNSLHNSSRKKNKVKTVPCFWELTHHVLIQERNGFERLLLVSYNFCFSNKHIKWAGLVCYERASWGVFVEVCYFSSPNPS